MGPEDLQVVKYTEATTLSDWAFAPRHPPRGAFSIPQSARLQSQTNARLVVHQKLETSSIAYALDLAGWALRICSVVKYIEALTLSDWAFALKAPPHGVPFLFRSHDRLTGCRVLGMLDW